MTRTSKGSQLGVVKKKKKLHYLKAEEIRQKTKSSLVIFNYQLCKCTPLNFIIFSLYVKSVLAITDHPSYYKTCMKSFEEEDLELIEYIRKSKGKEKKIMCESDC